jgi:hypothetical protein
MFSSTVEKVCAERESPDIRHMTMSDRNIMIARVLRDSEVVRNHCCGASRPLQFDRRGDEASAF